MHELGIARDFWNIIKQSAESNGLTRISKITIVLGEASGIEVDFLRHSLKDHTLPGTIAELADLEFISEPLKARCRACGSEIHTTEVSALSCPRCSGADIEIISGRDMYVQSIEGE